MHNPRFLPPSLPNLDSTGRHFTWLTLLGQGGFGEVYLARMKSASGLERNVAVKLLQHGLDPRSQAVERLRDEARMLTSLQHPVLLAAIDLVEFGGRGAFVTEYVEGQDLSECIDPEDQGRMPMSVLIEVVEQVASALDVAWRQLSVVHRDIKPQNIRIGVHGNVKLLDFGIARSALSGRAAKTESAILVGTMRYLAPERFELERSPESSSDVFALGAVLYEGLSCKPLIDNMGPSEQIRMVLIREDWDNLVERRLAELTHLPDHMVALLRDTLAHDSKARPTAGELARRCEKILNSSPGITRLNRWCRERRWPDSPLSVAPAEDTSQIDSAPAVQPAPWLAPELTNTFAGTQTTPEKSEPKVSALISAVTGARGLRFARWVAALSASAGIIFAVVGISILSLLLALTIVLTQSDVALVPVEPIIERPAPPPAPVPLASPEPLAAPVSAPPPVPPQAPARPTPSKQPPVSPPSAPAPAPAPAPEASPASMYTVVFSSIPGGAEIRLVTTAERLGTTPLSRLMPAGEITVQMLAPGGSSITRTLQISKNSPKRYVWHIEEDRFEAGYLDSLAPRRLTNVR